MIITLCGSLRFEEEFRLWDERLTLQGYSVFTVSVYPSFKGEKTWYDEVTKVKLDEAHLRKIDASSAILVINKNGYIGESTAREIRHAELHGKVAYYLYGIDGNKVCPYFGCRNSLQKPPCALCYE